VEITDIRVHVLEGPDAEDVANSSQHATVIEVETDAGITGIGSVAGAPPVVAKAVVEAPLASSITTGLREVLLGRDPHDVEVLWNEMYERTYGYGRKGAAVATLSGIDIALWDIIAKAAEQPLHAMLGGKHRDSVRAYASTLFPEDPDDVDHMRREAERALDDGFTAIKYGWGGITEDREKDRALVETARETLGPDVDLMIDIGMGWQNDLKRGVKQINELDDAYDLFWVEEPVYADNIDGYARISRACSPRIVGGEREYTLYGFRDFIDRGRVDGVQPDVAIGGGITHVEKIATLAAERGIPIYPHGYSTDIVIAANLHLIAANRNAPLLEYCIEDSPLRWEVVNEEFSVEDGYVTIPDEPGLGVSLNRSALDEYATEPWTDWS
jgi:L-alanine-DL-glutamate epimerase-like enolase superfamily enzyme